MTNVQNTKARISMYTVALIILVVVLIILLGTIPGAQQFLQERATGFADAVLLLFGNKNVVKPTQCFSQQLAEVAGGDILVTELGLPTNGAEQTWTVCDDGTCYLNGTGVSVGFQTDTLWGHTPRCDGRGNYRIHNQVFECMLANNEGWKDARRAVFRGSSEETRLHWEIYNAGLEYLEKVHEDVRGMYDGLLTKRFVLYGHEEGLFGSGSLQEHAFAVWTSGHWIVKEGTRTAYEGTNDREALKAFDTLVRGSESDADGVYYTIFEAPKGAESYEQTSFSLSFRSSAKPYSPLGAYTPYIYDLNLLFEKDANAIQRYRALGILPKDSLIGDHGAFKSLGNAIGGDNEINSEEDLQGLTTFFANWKKKHAKVMDDVELEDKAHRVEATILNQKYDVYVDSCEAEGLTCDVTQAPILIFKQVGGIGWYALRFNPHHRIEDRIGTGLATDPFTLVYYDGTRTAKPAGTEQDYLLKGYAAYQRAMRSLTDQSQCNSPSLKPGQVIGLRGGPDTTCDFQNRCWTSKAYSFLEARC